MRRHHEALNYFDGQPANYNYRFSRTQGQDDGLLIDNLVGVMNAPYNHELRLTRGQVTDLRNMLTEVLEDWQ